MTDQPEERVASKEPEVTEAMLDAGRRVLLASEDYSPTDRVVLAAIFRAMDKARPK